jgi:Mg-chelatase subunit ChlD
MRSLSGLRGILGLIASTACGQESPVLLGPIYPVGDGVAIVLEAPVRLRAFRPEQIRLDTGSGRSMRVDRVIPFRDLSRRMAIVIAVDVSGSMRGGINATQEALAAIAGELTQSADVALIGFSDGISSRSDFASNEGQLRAAIPQLNIAGSRTAIYAAVEGALGMLKARPGTAERRRVLIISDGQETESEVADKTVEMAERSGYAIDAVGRGTVQSGFAQSLERLTDHTGGVFVDSRRRGAETALRQVLAAALDSPVAVFSRAPTGGNGSRVSLRIDLPNGDTHSYAINLAASLGSGKKGFSSMDIFVVALVLVAGIVGVLLYKRRKKAAPQPVPAPQRVTHQKAATEPLYDRKTRISHDTDISAEGFTIRATAGPVMGRTVILDGPQFTVGRDDGNDLPLHDEFVSEQHARFEIRNGQLFLIDLGSTNGTQVNGARIDQPTLLAANDTVRIGTTEFRVMAAARMDRG